MSDGAPDRPDVLGRRIGAALVDFLVLAITVVPWSAATGGAQSGHGRVSFDLHGVGFLTWGVFQLAYYFGCEATWGQTIGKRALAIRVAREDGGRAAAGAVLARTALRIVDVLPVLYLVGFVAVLASRERQQRIGDRVARTIVTRA